MKPIRKSPGRLIDSHCHLQSLPAEERERALDEARARGVNGFLVPAIRLGDVEELLSLASRHPDVWCAVGVHPHEASRWDESSQKLLAGFLKEPDVVAVGECGLDFHYDFASPDDQRRALCAQWDLAVEFQLPVVVHNRESDSAMVELLARYSRRNLTGVLHSFAAGEELAETARGCGFLFGFSGMLTFSRAENVRSALRATPLDRLLVETDTPYLAPVPYRGKPNRPAYVVEVVERLAREQVLTLEEARRVTTENFFRLFARAED